jgi:competence protein ComFC
MKIIEFILEYLIDTIVPPDQEVRKIECMAPGAFLREALNVPINEPIPGILHFLPYRSKIAKTAIVEIKNHENRKVARLLGSLLYDLLYSEITDFELFQNLERPLLLPIPITKRKKCKRGWNQCELILSALRQIDSNKTFDVCFGLLVKIRENEDQVGKGRAARFKNLENCFFVQNKKNLKGRDVIIFDDIVTTGATLSEAKRVLLTSGARKVICVAMAH